METLLDSAAQRVFEEWQITKESFLVILNRFYKGRYDSKQRSEILKMVRELRQAQKNQVREWIQDFYKTVYISGNYHIVGVD